MVRIGCCDASATITTSDLKSDLRAKHVTTLLLHFQGALVIAIHFSRPKIAFSEVRSYVELIYRTASIVIYLKVVLNPSFPRAFFLVVCVVKYAHKCHDGKRAPGVVPGALYKLSTVHDVSLSLDCDVELLPNETSIALHSLSCSLAIRM